MSMSAVRVIQCDLCGEKKGFPASVPLQAGSPLRSDRRQGTPEVGGQRSDSTRSQDLIAEGVDSEKK